MTRRVPNRSRRSWARFALFLLLLFPLVPSGLAAAEPFPGYPEAVRNQAIRVVEAAGPGKGEALEREVRALRRAMFENAILSMNAVPDRIFDRAAREGWKRGSYESMRAVTRVAPLSVPLWSWLAWEGATAVPARGVPLPHRRVVGSASPVRAGAARERGVARPVRLRLGVLVRGLGVAQPPPAGAPRADVGRRPPPQASPPAGVLRLRGRPRRLCRLRSRCGVGIAAAAVFWIALSTAYLRRGEIAIGGTAILLLAGVFLGGGFLEAVRPVAATARQGGWLGGRDTSTAADRAPGMPDREC